MEERAPQGRCRITIPKVGRKISVREFRPGQLSKKANTYQKKPLFRYLVSRIAYIELSSFPKHFWGKSTRQLRRASHHSTISLTNLDVSSEHRTIFIDKRRISKSLWGRHRSLSARLAKPALQEYAGNFTWMFSSPGAQPSKRFSRETGPACNCSQAGQKCRLPEQPVSQ